MNSPVNSFREGLMTPGLFPIKTLPHPSIMLLISLFNTLEAKPTAIPLEPFNNTVGMIGKKYLGSIDSPSSSL